MLTWAELSASLYRATHGSGAANNGTVTLQIFRRRAAHHGTEIWELSCDGAKIDWAYSLEDAKRLAEEWAAAQS